MIQMDFLIQSTFLFKRQESMIKKAKNLNGTWLEQLKGIMPPAYTDWPV